MIDQWNLTKAQIKAAEDERRERSRAYLDKRAALKDKVLSELLADGEWHVPGGKGWGNLRSAWAILFEAGKEGLVEYNRRSGEFRLTPSDKGE